LIPGILTSLLIQSLLWIARKSLSLGWQAGKQVLRLPPTILWASLAAGLATSTAGPAHAGWFSRRPDSVTLSANETLERAASIANQAASQQADQNIRVAEAITSLSAERTQLADLLSDFSKHATRDSAWASALLTLGPVAIVVAILAVGCLALWLAMNEPPLPDADLMASVLMDEATEANPELPQPSRRGSRPSKAQSSLAGPLDTERRAAIEAAPFPHEEMPF
jgi:hypothetical protein